MSPAFDTGKPSVSSRLRVSPQPPSSQPHAFRSYANHHSSFAAPFMTIPSPRHDCYDSRDTKYDLYQWYCRKLVHFEEQNRTARLDSPMAFRFCWPSSYVTIFAHAHLGSSSYVAIDGDGPFSFLEKSSIAVAPPIQNQDTRRVPDELVAAHDPATRALLVGHRIEGLVYPRIAEGAHHVALTYMLFPATCHIS